MERTQELANRLTEVILDGTWVANTNYREQLENLDWRTAVRKIGPLNSIAELAQHIHYYLDGIKNAFITGNLEIRDKFSFDFPPIESQKEWRSFLTKFWKDTETLAELILNMPQEKLSKSFIDQKYGTYHRNIDGLMEHSYYHLGQIVLLKKLIEKGH